MVNHLQIEKNTKGGRDFVIGDLHGCLDRLHQALTFLNFDFEKDRLFSVGDLIDRGPHSFQCLQLLYEPWFFSVKANHEELMIDYFFDGPTGAWWSQNGGCWGTRFKKETYSDDGIMMLDLVKKAEKLPYMMTVERQDGKFFHIIHAELDSIKPLTDADLDDEKTFSEVAFTMGSDGQSITWGRYIFISLYGMQLDERRIKKFNHFVELNKVDAMFSDELSTIYSGHTPMQAPVRFKKLVNLDTCAYKAEYAPPSMYGSSYTPPNWAGLTITEPLTDRFWHASNNGVVEVRPVELG